MALAKPQGLAKAWFTFTMRVVFELFRAGIARKPSLRGRHGSGRCAAIAASVLASATVFFINALPAATLPAYYAHETVQDAQGVIAPWYQGLNGQLDERVNIAVNVYTRYPWVDKPKAVMAAPVSGSCDSEAQ